MGGSRVLIIGGTGYIGKHVTNASLAQGHPTFLLVRDTKPSNPEKAQLLESFTSKGATLIQGSIDDYGSLVEAVKKVDVVISAVGAQQIADQFTLIKAIKDVGTVKRFIPSDFGNDVDKHHAVEPMKSMFDLKIKLRRTIEAEGIPHTYVVPHCFAGYFLTNLSQLGLTAPPRDKTVIYGDGTTKAVYMKEEDIGTFTIKAVDDPRTLNKTLYMRPPANTISTNDLVALWESKIGKTLEKVYLSEKQVLKLLQDDYASLVEAVKKVDVVISAVGSQQIADQFTLIKAIKDVGTVKRFFPSEFGNDVDKHRTLEPMKSSYDLKIKLRRTIEAEGIPHTYVASHCFAGYFLSNISQLGLTAPPRDKIVIYGDGTTKAVYMKEEDIGTFTIKAVDDPRTLNKTLYLRPPANTISTNDLVALWESKIGKTLEKVYLSEEQVLKLLQDTPFPGNFMVCIFYTIYVKGDQTNFEIGADAVEASALYPDVKYTTVEEYISAFV